MIHTLSERAIQDLSRRLSTLESASLPYLRENRTSFSPEPIPKICRTINNGVTYPSGTANPPNNTFWVEFGKYTYNDSAIGNTSATWETYSPIEVLKCRTLCGGWVEESAYVVAIYYHDLWWLTELPQFYYGTSSGSITAGSVTTPGSGTVNVRVKNSGGFLTDIPLLVRNIGTAIATNKPCYVWRSADSFMAVELC